MLLSVLTPSYRAARWLPDALESVAHSGVPHLEHVVADGGSDDGTVALLEGWDRSRLQWLSEPDRGQSHALNRGIEMAQGEWVGWLNADEFYLDGALRRVADELRRSGDEFDVLYGDCVFVDADGRFVRAVPQHRFSPFVLRRYGCFIPSCASFFRRDLLASVGLDEQCREMMDWDLYLKLAEAGARFRHLPVAVAAFRLHAEQVTASSPGRYGPEASMLRERHGIRTAGPASVRALRAVGRAAHVSLKLRDGAALRQYRTAQHWRGRDMRWFAAPAA